jgi:hypothetical protein
MAEDVAIVIGNYGGCKEIIQPAQCGIDISITKGGQAKKCLCHSSVFMKVNLRLMLGRSLSVTSNSLGA